MSKRKRTWSSGSAGRTWDKYPQTLTFTAAQTSNDTAATTTLTLPKEVFGTPSSPTILEIIAIYFEHGANLVENADGYIQCFVSTRDHSTTACTPATTDVIAWYTRKFQAAGTAASLTTEAFPFTYRCSWDGFGQLVATDYLYIQVVSANTSTTNTVRGKILYRFVKVGVTEYVGMIQSQQ